MLPGRRTPWTAIVATTAVAMILSATGTVAALAETVVLLLLFVFVSTNVAVLVLRRDRTDTDHFRAPTILPVLAVGAGAVLAWSQLDRSNRREGLVRVGFGVVLAVTGVGLFYVAWLAAL